MTGPSSNRNQAVQTVLAQPSDGRPRHFHSATSAVHRVSTVLFDSVVELKQASWRRAESLSYGREGTPTTLELERRLSTLLGATYTLLTPSGLAGFAVVSIAFLGQGTTVAVPLNGYGSGSEMLESVLDRYNVAVRRYDPLDRATWNSAIDANVQLVWIEAPGSITLEVPDLTALVAHAKGFGAIVAADDTYGAGVSARPFALGVDVVIQALTKLQSGGSDAVLGSVSCNDPHMNARLCETRHYLGMHVGADDASLVLRGLPTLAMRYAHSDAAGRRLASILENVPEIRLVMHPALKSSPGHLFWATHFTGAAGLFSVAVAEPVSAAQVVAFVEALHLFRLGYSWGGSTSLVMVYAETHPSVERLAASLGEGLRSIVRFWVGLEDPDDLERDLLNALPCLTAPTVSA